MHEVTIDKAKLLETLKANRSSHREMFERALAGWKAAVTKGLDEALTTALAEAEAGKKYQTTIHLALPQPTDHTADYDDIIDSVTWHENSTITLDRAQFRQFVRDDWGWMQDFLSNSAMYGAA